MTSQEHEELTTFLTDIGRNGWIKIFDELKNNPGTALVLPDRMVKLLQKVGILSPQSNEVADLPAKLAEYLQQRLSLIDSGDLH